MERSIELEQSETGPKAEDRPNVGGTERWVSAVGGTALIAYGLSRRSISGALMAVAGGALLYRGKTGHCAAYQRLGISTARMHGTELVLREAITIARPAPEVYSYYRHLENLPRFMQHVESVKFKGYGQTHWVVRLAGKRLEWDAELVDDIPDQLIRWRTLDNPALQHSGTVEFRKAPADRGTELMVTLVYQPPLSGVGALFGKVAETMTQPIVHQELRRLKAIIECGEIPTTEGQTSGRTSKLKMPQRKDKPAQLPERTETPAMGRPQQIPATQWS